MEMIKRYLRISLFNFKANNALFNLQTALLIALIGPLIEVLFFVAIAKYFTQAANLQYWIVGNTLMVSIWIVIFSIASYFDRERKTGTLKYLFSNSINPVGLLLSLAIIPILLALVQVILILLIAICIFKIQIPLATLPLFSGNLLICLFSTAMFGLFLSSIGLVIPQSILILNIAVYFIMIFSCANYPISVLPVSIRWISLITPLYHGIESARLILKGGLSIRHMVTEMGLGIVFLLLSIKTVNGLKRKAKDLGTIELY